MRTAPVFLALVVAGAGLFPGPAPAQTQAAPAPQSEHRRADAVLQQAARFEHQVTGVTVSERGRIFVNFPRWTEDLPVSVAEVMKDGSVRPYPNQQWNAWRNVRSDELDPSTHLVCLQSVVADGRGSVWVVDPASPAVQRIVPGGPKLVRIDLATDRVTQVIRFGQDVAIPGSYLNDVRFSNDGKHAYLTDAGQRGALVVVELASGKARRVLDGYPSTQPEKSVVVRTDGKPLRYPDGRPVLLAADSIALSSDGAWLYWKALGYTHAFGGYAGAHAQYVRVPFADNDCFKVPNGAADETALFLSDAAPTGYMDADFCNIQPGDTVAVWGRGGVGLMAQQSARLMGAERVIAIDRFPERLQMAREHAGSETIDYTQVDSVLDVLNEMTGGHGPDACLDAVGMEAHGTEPQCAYDLVKQALRLETDRGQALREAIMACRKGGTLSVLGVYGLIDKFPMGVIMNKGMTMRTAQQHGQAYMEGPGPLGRYAQH